MSARSFTWIEFGSKTKIDEAHCIPGVGRSGLEHDVARGDIQVANLAVHVHVVQGLQSTVTGLVKILSKDTQMSS